MKRSPRWVVWMAACVFVLLGVAAAPRKSSAIWIGLPGIAPLPEIGDPDMPNGSRIKPYVPIFGMGRMMIIRVPIPSRVVVQMRKLDEKVRPSSGRLE